MSTVIASPVGRPRDPETTAVILEATLRLLAEYSYAATSTAQVAALARASKATLYRRWPSKFALVADAIRHGLRTANPVTPRTGDPREDLIRVLENLIRAMAETPLGGAIRAVISDAAHEPQLSAALQEVTTEARERGPMRALVLEAQDRGMLAPDADIGLILDLMLGAPYFQLIVRQVTPRPEQARALVDQLIPLPSTPHPGSPP